MDGWMVEAVEGFWREELGRVVRREEGQPLSPHEWSCSGFWCPIRACKAYNTPSPPSARRSARPPSSKQEPVGQILHASSSERREGLVALDREPY
eukprot:3248255-Rhodomonas_salina.2